MSHVDETVPTHRRPRRPARWLHRGWQGWLAQPPSARWLAAFTWLVYTLYSTLQWRRYDSPSWDLGIFTQVVQQYARLQAPVVHIKGADYNILGDHFHPMLAVLAPIYAVFPSAYTLLVLQALLIAVSVFFVAKAAHEFVNPSAGWLIGLAYAICWGVQQAVAVQFHEVALAVPLLAVAGWQLLREHWVSAAIWAALLVFVKEDLGLTVVMFGVVIGWRAWCSGGPRRHHTSDPETETPDAASTAHARRGMVVGAALSLWGVLLFWLTLKVILPGLNPQAQYDYDKYLDPSAVLADPLGILGEILTNDKKMATALLLAACTGFLLLRSSLGLLALPTLAWRFLSNNEGHWGATWHYSLVLMPIAYLAAVDGIASLRRSRVRFFRAYARHGAVIVTTFAFAIVNQLPLFELRNPEKWRPSTRAEAAQQALAAVPPGATVATDTSLMSYLVARRDVYYIGQQGNPVTDFVVIDNIAGGWNMKVDALDYAAQIHPGTRWRRLVDADGYQVVQHIG